MNLNAIAGSVIAAVNPPTPLCILISNGNSANADFTRNPSYKPPIMRMGQVQPLSTGDIRHIDGLGLEGVHRAIYINGKVDGLVRVENKGGDLIIADGKVWLVTEVSENWGNGQWVKALVTLQDQVEAT